MIQDFDMRISKLVSLSLPLLMARILADHAHNALAADDPAFGANLSY